MKHLTKKRDHKSRTELTRPHPNRKNKLRVDKKLERQEATKEIELLWPNSEDDKNG